MCAGALFWSQVSKVVFGAADKKRGYQTEGGRLYPKTKLVGGVLAEECGRLLKEFFRGKRI